MADNERKAGDFSSILNEAKKSSFAFFDRKARKERDQLEGPSAKKVRQEIHRIAVWLIRFGAALLAILITIRFWHLLTPESWRWLSDSELQSIDKMLFSSAFGGVVLAYLKDVMVHKSDEA